MISTPELADLAKKKAGLASNYALAKKLGCSPSALLKWYKGGSMDDKHALICADLADLDSRYVLDSIAAERAQRKNDTALFEFWKNRAMKHAPKAIAVCFGLVAVFASLPPFS